MIRSINVVLPLPDQPANPKIRIIDPIVPIVRRTGRVSTRRRDRG
jgi:hypothetical protein